MEIKSWGHKGAILFAFFIISGIAGEAALRLLAPTPAVDRYYVWPPGIDQTFRAAPGVMAGITRPARFTTNEDGIRGDSFNSNQRYRILAVGGSTTECLFLDGPASWPGRLQTLLNKAAPRGGMWVGNVGKAGHHSGHHVLQVQHLLEQFPRIDAMVVMVGVNDLQLALSHEGGHAEDSRQLMEQAFSLFPNWDADLPIYKRTEWWRRLRFVREFVEWNRDRIQDSAGSVYNIWRGYRQAAPAVREKLPDLTKSLDRFASNIEAMIALAEARRVRPVFATQAVMWRPDLDERLQQLLWMGGVGDFQSGAGTAYYSVSALSEAMELYNRRLLEVCDRKGVLCVDLAHRLRRDTTVFYDDCHLNESGARQVADLLAAALLPAVVQALDRGETDLRNPAEDKPLAP